MVRTKVLTNSYNKKETNKAKEKTKMGKLEEKTAEVKADELKKRGFGVLKGISRFGEEDRAKGQLEE